LPLAGSCPVRHVIRPRHSTPGPYTCIALLASFHMPPHLTGLAVVTVLFVAACSSSANHMESVDTSADRCALRPQDSTFMAGGPVYRDCAVKSKAVFLTQSIHPEFHPSMQGTGSACYSADLEYVVDAKGLVETKTARVVRTNSEPLVEALLSILPQWKFQPARLNDQPVRQIVLERRVVKFRVVTSPSAPSGSAHGSPSC
jgi:hypothetical protein